MNDYASGHATSTRLSVRSMFRITDICNIAVQIEKNGEASYRRAGERIADPEIQKMFYWMADEEHRHGKWFASLTADIPIPPERESLEEMGRSLLQEMVEGQTFSLVQEQLEKTASFSELLAQTREFEKDTVLFYEFLRDLIDDQDTARQLEIIIGEERQHARQLAELEQRVASEEA